MTVRRPGCPRLHCRLPTMPPHGTSGDPRPQRCFRAGVGNPPVRSASTKARMRSMSRRRTSLNPSERMNRPLTLKKYSASEGAMEASDRFLRAVRTYQRSPAALDSVALVQGSLCAPRPIHVTFPPIPWSCGMTLIPPMPITASNPYSRTLPTQSLHPKTPSVLGSPCECAYRSTPAAVPMQARCGMLISYWYSVVGFRCRVSLRFTRSRPPSLEPARRLRRCSLRCRATAILGNSLPFFTAIHAGCQPEMSAG